MHNNLINKKITCIFLIILILTKGVFMSTIDTIEEVIETNIKEEKEVKSIYFDDKYIADFIAKYVSRLKEKGEKWVYQNHEYYRFNGKFYEKIDNDWLGENLYHSLGSFASRNKIKECISLLKMRLDSAVVPDGNFLNFKNGILDLNTMTLYPHSEKVFFSDIYNFDFDSEAQCHRFKEFLYTIFLGREALIKVDQEWLGYLLTHKTSLQKARINTGGGKNGKSTHREVMRAIVGENYYLDGQVSTLWDKRGVHRMEGKKALFCEETNRFTTMRSAQFKESVDGMLHAERKYQDPFTFRNTAKININTNELPSTKDTTDGFYRRLMIFPYDYRIPEEKRDPDFYENVLKPELPGIMNYAIEGLKRLEKQEGFSDSRTLNNMLKKYKDESNPLELFIREKCNTGEDAYIVKKHLYNEFNNFCKENGFNKFKYNRPQFSKKLLSFAEQNDLNISRAQKRMENDRKRIYQGIELI